MYFTFFFKRRKLFLTLYIIAVAVVPQTFTIDPPNVIWVSSSRVSLNWTELYVDGIYIINNIIK